LDQPAERLSAEVAAATDAGCQVPADGARVFDGQQLRSKGCAARLRSHQEELLAMRLELQTNRAILDGLANWYGVFVFTGGPVPTARWNLVAMTSYLEHPSAADCLSTSGIRRYRHLVQAISESGHLGAGPRTLRCRHELGEKFGQAASEIRVLTSTLELSVTKAVEGLRPPSPPAEMRSALEPAK
jgi:hypothetical protein